MPRLSGWTLADNKLPRTFEFQDFVQSLSFVNSLVVYFETVDQHPDVCIAYGDVTFELTRYDVGGKVTDRDVEVAKKIVRLQVAFVISAGAGGRGPGRLLLDSLEVFVESRHELPYVLLDTGRGESDQRMLNGFPQLQGLRAGNSRVPRDRCETDVPGTDSPARPRSQRSAEQGAADERGAQQHIGPFPELLPPIGRVIDLLLELSEIRPDSFPRSIDARFYLVGCFIHSRCSFSVSTVRSGIG